MKFETINQNKPEEEKMSENKGILKNFTDLLQQEMIEEAKVSVIPGISFGANGEDFIRIACTVSIEQLDVAFTRLENALKK